MLLKQLSITVDAREHRALTHFAKRRNTTLTALARPELAALIAEAMTCYECWRVDPDRCSEPEHCPLGFSADAFNEAA